MLIENSAAKKAHLANELHQCSFATWYEKFEKIAIDSKIIEIPKHIVEYLLDEIVILPKECYPNEDEDEEYVFSSEGGAGVTAGNAISADSDDDEDNDTPRQSPTFPEFSNWISDTIESLRGSVFLKTNWHAPKDAYWITVGQTLKAKDITDVYQLLKASSIIKNDLALASAQSEGSGATLVLRKWFEIHPATEFRCFVRGRDLIAITPRDWPQFHEHINKERLDIISDIVSFFKEKIKNKFALENFVFDVVRYAKDRVKLLDFSIFNKQFTEGLAFDWEFLESDAFPRLNLEDQDDPEFRYLSIDCGIQPTRRNNYGVPQDIINMFSEDSSLNGNEHFTDVLARRLQDEMSLGNEQS